MKCFKINKYLLIPIILLFICCLLLLLTYKKEHLESIQPNIGNTSVAANVDIVGNMIAALTKELEKNTNNIITRITSQELTGNIVLDTNLKSNNYQKNINEIVSGNMIASTITSNVEPNVVVSGQYLNEFKENIYGSGVCKDDPTVATYCPYWATLGDCKTKEIYMNDYCKKTCNKC